MGKAMDISKTDQPEHPRGSYVQALELLAITLAGAIVFLPYLLHGAPYEDSYLLNVNWAEGFIQELEAGTMYPRWIPSLWDGTGAADFYFYAPLPFYVTAGVKAICGVCDVPHSLAVAGFLLYVLSGFGMLGLMRTLRVPGPIVLGAVAFLLMPYHFGNWSVRQAFGELTATAFVPYFLWGMVEAVRGRGYLRLAVATGLIGLSHLPTLLILGLVSVVLSMTVLRPASGRVFLHGLLAGAIGFAAAAIYWLPAISLLETVNADALGVHEWRANMLRPWISEWTIWESKIWLPFLMLSLLTAFSIASTGRPLTHYARLQIVLLCISWFFVTPLSDPVWENTSIDIIQFPWRFLLVADVAFAMTLPVLWARTIGTVGLPAAWLQWIVGITSVTATVVLVLSLAFWWEKPQIPLVLQRASNLKIGALEWLGRSEAAQELSWKELLKNGLPPIVNDPRIVRSTGFSAVIEILETEPLMLRFRATCPTSCTVVLRRGYWVYWEVRAEESGRVIPIRPTMGFPLITINLPTGDAIYRLTLRHPPIERVAAVISLLAVVAIIGILILDVRSRRGRIRPD